MQVHREHTVSACRRNHIRNQLGRNRVARLALAVLTGVAEIRHHRRDAPRRRAAAGINHNQQLHQMVVDRFAGRLDKEYVRAAHRLADGNRSLAVRKGRNRRVAQPQAKLRGNTLRQRRIGITRKNLDIIAVSNHFHIPPERYHLIRFRLCLTTWKRTRRQGILPPAKSNPRRIPRNLNAARQKRPRRWARRQFSSKARAFIHHLRCTNAVCSAVRNPFSHAPHGGGRSSPHKPSDVRGQLPARRPARPSLPSCPQR